MPFRDPPPRMKKTKSGDPPGAKRKGRGKKAAEIAEDPIEDDEDYAPRLTFPDGVDGTAASATTTATTAFVSARRIAAATTARAVTRAKAVAVPETIYSDDDDDDVTIIDPPPRSTQASSRAPQTREEVSQQCYVDLTTCEDKVSLLSALSPRLSRRTNEAHFDRT